MENLINQRKLINLMMTNVLNLGKFSYELQEKREKILISQSNQLAKMYLLAGLLFSLLKLNDLNVFSIILFTSLMLSLAFAIMAGWRYKYVGMLDIDDFFEEVYNNNDSYKTQYQFNIQWKYQISALHKSKKENNDKRAKFILISMISFLCSILIATFLMWFYFI